MKKKKKIPSEVEGFFKQVARSTKFYNSDLYFVSYIIILLTMVRSFVNKRNCAIVLADECLASG